MKIAYFGLPLGALALLHRGHTPLVIACGHPGAAGFRRVRRRAEASLLLSTPNLNDETTVRALASLELDAILCWYWPRKIPASILALPRWGTYGVHPSLLPRHPGPDPFFHAIDAGDTETGVTLHHLAAEYDTGMVVQQKRIAISASDNAYRLARRLDRPSLELLLYAADALARTQAQLAGTPQASKMAWAGSPTDDEQELNFHESVARVERRVRALAPSPAAFCTLENTEVYVLRARTFAGEVPRALHIGEAFATAAGVAVVCADGALEISEVEDSETGEKYKGAAIMQLLRSL